MQHAWTVLSCLLGHDYILSQIENEELEFALVLEDDCTPANGTEVTSGKLNQQAVKFAKRRLC